MESFARGDSRIGAAATLTVEVFIPVAIGVATVAARTVEQPAIHLAAKIGLLVPCW